MAETIVRRSILEKVGEDFGPDARVKFTLPNGTIVEVCHAGRQDPEGTLTVRVINGSLAVLPNGSNTIHVMTKHEGDETWAPSERRLPR
jgi:hypothetical protein